MVFKKECRYIILIVITVIVIDLRQTSIIE